MITVFQRKSIIPLCVYKDLKRKIWNFKIIIPQCLLKYPAKSNYFDSEISEEEEQMLSVVFEDKSSFNNAVVLAVGKCLGCLVPPQMLHSWEKCSQ